MFTNMLKHSHIFFLFVSISLIVSSCSNAPASTTPIALATYIQRPTDSSSIPCTMIHTPVTPEAALGAEYESRGHVSGPVNAAVTIVAFSDYQCMSCAILAASLKQVRLIHEKDVRLIYLNDPQVGRADDNLAIQAVEAADLQGKFWGMHDLLFEKQAEWTNLTAADFETWTIRQAADLGMDPARFQSDYGGALVSDRLRQAVQFASSVQSFAPPLLFVNSTSPYTSLADFASLDMVIRLDALIERQFSSCPSPKISPLKQYIATLHTPKGNVVLQLYPEKTPLAVGNFVFLARNSWYDGITFYRVLPNQLVMTGDPSGTGYGNPGYLFETEIPSGLNFDQPGMVAMDNNGPDTNGSRFFITLAPAPQMDGHYTIFGQVLSGLDVLSSLTARDPQPGIYQPPGDELTSITIEER